MEQTTLTQYPVDNASILYLSLMRKNHTNTFRFTMTLTEEICPDTLQRAVDRVYRRFPTVIAGFRPGFFCYSQIPASLPPQVQPDPGVLHTMTAKEIRDCAYRVLYAGRSISIEAFHALTDGYGAIASFTTLVAEYLRLKHGVDIPAVNTLKDIADTPAMHETTDSYLDYESGAPLHLPSRYAYQLPSAVPTRSGVHTSTLTVETARVLCIARNYGVSITALLSSVMASSVMEIQQRYHAGSRVKPVRIMVPVDLRRLFPSRTLRNFILYALPTMEPQDRDKPFPELLRSFGRQLRAQTERKLLASIMAYNVRTQRAFAFQAIPLCIKRAAMRFAYRYFGESNSSITLTNLGNVTLPEEMGAFVENIEVFLTPRAQSPYSCAIISFNGRLSINVSRFGQKAELEEVFFRKLNSIMQGAAI